MSRKRHLSQPSHSAPRPARPDPGPRARVLLTAVGLLLLAVGAFANLTDSWIFAAHWKLFIRLPGMQARQYWFLPLWWVTFGLPALMFGLALLSRGLRRALAAPWRSLRFGVPLALVLLFLAFSMFPWEFAGTKVCDTGSKMVFYLTVAGAGFVLFVAGFYRQLRFLDRPVQRLYDRLMALDRRLFMLVTAGFTLLVANLVSLFVFEHLAHIQDSTAQLFQARIFASGRLFLPTPAFADFFDYTHIINNGRWYSQYPFLHSLLLVPGALVGMPWIINPLLGALTVPAIHLLGRELYDERTGRQAALLACLTPFLFNMAGEYMNHTSALLFLTLFLLFFFRTLRTGRWFEPLVAGLLLGLVVNIRPYTAAAVALPVAVYGVARLVRQPARLLPRFAMMVGVLAAVTSLTFVYNWLVNGDPLLFGYVVKWGPGHEIGFGKSGWGALHTPFRGLVNTGNDLNLINKFLFEWPVPALLPIGLLFAAGNRDGRDWLLLTMFLTLTLAYFFYWFHNVCFGPRFLFESSTGLVLLTVRGINATGRFLRTSCRIDVNDATVGRFWGRILPLMTLLMIGIGLPPLFVMYNDYGGFDGSMLRAVRRAGISNAVVFCGHLGPGLNENRLDLGGDIVYAKDFGYLNAALTLAYPDREYYYANKDTLRPLADIRFPGSRLRRAFEEMAQFIAETNLAEFRTIIWPFRDVPPPGIDPQAASPRFTDFREVSREIFVGEHVLDDYLPALACWMLNDQREHLQVFAFMNDVQNFVAGGYKFTLRKVTSDGSGAVYGIRPATGEEMTLPGGQTGTVPFR